MSEEQFGNAFPWDNNGRVEEQYHKDNVLIIETGKINKKALVFFSSNGIYFPNEEQVFVQRIIKNNHYDWLNISKHRAIHRTFEKIVFVRDIYKQWYVTGISNRVNTVEKLIIYLESMLGGYSVVTCGSSAGGYMAVLAGAMLGAERIICNCGQFRIDDPKNGPFIERGLLCPDKRKWFDLKPYLETCYDNVYYLYSVGCEGDVLQNSYISTIPVHRFAIKSHRHSETVKTICYPYLLSVDKNRLDKLANEYAGRIISRDQLYNDLCSTLDKMIDLPIFVLKKVLRKFLHHYKKNS